MEPVHIGARTLAADRPPYVIAEIGSNHNGDMGLCKELIEAAAACGAHAAKFQSWTDASLISQAEYERNVSYGDKKRHFGTLREMVEEYQLTHSQHEQAAQMCADAGVDFLSSAFSVAEIDLLVGLGVPAIKLASMDVNHPLLLRAASESGKTVLLSTGMATLDEIARAVDVLRRGSGFALMHCVSLYPAAPETLNLRNIAMLHETFGCPVGFSDHSEGIAAAIASVALGCTTIEKHFTVDCSLPGWDHWMSSDPEQMKALCDGVAAAHAALGSHRRTVSEGEIEQRKKFRRCIVVTRDIAAGETLALGDLDFKRPGHGIDPDQYPFVVGRRTSRDLSAGRELDWSDLC